MIVFGGRGGRGNEGRVQVDGLNTGASLNGGGVSGYRQDVENAAEVAITTSGGLGETEVGGPTMNIVPRTGGNTFTGPRLRHRLQRRHAGAATSPRSCSTPGCARRRRRTTSTTPASRSAVRSCSDRIWFYFARLLPRQRERRSSACSTTRTRGDIDQVDLRRRRRAGRRSSDGHGPIAAEPAPDVPALVARQAEPVLGRADQQQQPRRRAPRRPHRKPAAAITAGSACSR